MSRNYKEESKQIEIDTEGKEAFIENLKEKLDTLQDNVLYDDLLNEDNSLISDIFDVLSQKHSITKDDILELLEKRNEYIIGFEDFDTNMRIEEDINNVARLINDIYKIGKVNSLWKQKIKANKKVISSQLDNVSRAISDVAQSMLKKDENFEEQKKEIKILFDQKDIELLDINIEKNKTGRYIVNIYIKPCEDEQECRTYEIENILSRVLKSDIVLQNDICALKGSQNLCKQRYMTKDKFLVQLGFAHEKKNGSLVSGDSSVQTRLDDGKYLIALSDGMGSGAEARKSSQIAVKMLSRMLSQRI